MTFPETLNTKIFVKELIFPLVTHMVNSNARFRRYGIFKLGQGAKKLCGQICHTDEWSGFGI
jgi:hypothetical protein